MPHTFRRVPAVGKAASYIARLYIEKASLVPFPFELSRPSLPLQFDSRERVRICQTIFLTDMGIFYFNRHRPMPCRDYLYQLGLGTRVRSTLGASRPTLSMALVARCLHPQCFAGSRTPCSHQVCSGGCKQFVELLLQLRSARFFMRSAHCVRVSLFLATQQGLQCALGAWRLYVENNFQSN